MFERFRLWCRKLRQRLRAVIEKKNGLRRVMSGEFHIIEFRLAPDVIQKVSNRRRNQLVGCMHAHNELVVLNC